MKHRVKIFIIVVMSIFLINCDSGFSNKAKLKAMVSNYIQKKFKSHYHPVYNKAEFTGIELIHSHDNTYIGSIHFTTHNEAVVMKGEESFEVIYDGGDTFSIKHKTTKIDTTKDGVTTTFTDVLR